LAGKSAVVTGGGRGLGAAVAARLAAEGATGTVLDLPSALGDVPDGWGATAVDVRDESSVYEAFAGLERIDVLVAAGGIVPGWGGIAELDLDLWDDVLAVNARGAAATLKHAAPLLGDGSSAVLVG